MVTRNRSLEVDIPREELAKKSQELAEKCAEKDRVLDEMPDDGAGDPPAENVDRQRAGARRRAARRSREKKEITSDLTRQARELLPRPDDPREDLDLLREGSRRRKSRSKAGSK